MRSLYLYALGSMIYADFPGNNERRKYRRRRVRAVTRTCHRCEPGARRAHLRWWAWAVARRSTVRIEQFRARLADLIPALGDIPAALSSEHRLRVSKWDWRMLR